MDEKKVNLILASQSPRRAELLEEAGYQFTVFVPDADAEDQADKAHPPERLVVELAVRKAENVVCQLVHAGSNRPLSDCPTSRTIVLAADTIAVCHKQVLGKPVDRADARRMLRLMSGQLHHVLTGVCLWDVESDRRLERLEVTSLTMDLLSDDELDMYLSGRGWEGKAGGFGYQDGLDWVHIVEGLASNVVGLPVERLVEWIAELKPDHFQ